MTPFEVLVRHSIRTKSHNLFQLARKLAEEEIDEELHYLIESEDFYAEEKTEDHLPFLYIYLLAQIKEKFDFDSVL